MAAIPLPAQQYLAPAWAVVKQRNSSDISPAQAGRIFVVISAMILHWVSWWRKLNRSHERAGDKGQAQIF